MNPSQAQTRGPFAKTAAVRALRIALAAALTPVCLVAMADPSQPQWRAPQAAVYTPSANAVTALDLAYIDVDLMRQPGLAADGPDADFADWKVQDLSRLFRERFPKVLAANGLEGASHVLPAPEPGTEGAKLQVNSSLPLLVLQPVKLTKSKVNLFNKAGGVSFEVKWLQDAALPQPGNVRTYVTGGLGFDPVFGVLKTNRVDAAWVDKLLAHTLEILAKRGAVNLPEGKAKLPKD